MNYLEAPSSSSSDSGVSVWSTFKEKSGNSRICKREVVDGGRMVLSFHDNKSGSLLAHMSRFTSRFTFTRSHVSHFSFRATLNSASSISPYFCLYFYLRIETLA